MMQMTLPWRVPLSVFMKKRKYKEEEKKGKKEKKIELTTYSVSKCSPNNLREFRQKKGAPSLVKLFHIPTACVSSLI